MTNEDKILKALETLLQGQEQLESKVGSIENRLDRIEQDQSHISTALEAVAAGQKEQATKADLMDLNAKIDKVTKNQERRIEDLEKEAGIPNPHKN
jgi:predicted nuclease with TOPRIM domain